MEDNKPLMHFSENAESTAGEQDVIQKLSLLYAENAKVTATFWESRHKVMSRFFTASAAISGAVGWIYQQKEVRGLVFIPLLPGAAYCVVSYLTDRVNSKILLDCYATGKEIEQRLGTVAGAYTRISDHYKRVNYTVFLRALYLGSALLLLLMCVLAVAFVHSQPR